MTGDQSTHVPESRGLRSDHKRVKKSKCNVVLLDRQGQSRRVIEFSARKIFGKIH